MDRNMSSQATRDEDEQEASDGRRRYLKRSISPVRNTRNKKPKTGSSSNNELYYLNIPSNHLINKQQLELCGKIPLIVLRPLSLKTIKQSLNCNVKNNTNTTNLERDTRSQVINKLNNDLKENLIGRMTQLLGRSSIKYSSHHSSSVESMTLKIPVETSKLEQTNNTVPTDIVSSYGEKETCSQGDSEISKQLSKNRENNLLQDLGQISDSHTLQIPVETSKHEPTIYTDPIDFVSTRSEKETCSQVDREFSKQLSTITENNRLRDLGQISESPLWLQMLYISEDEDLSKTCYSETSLLRLGINTYKKTLFDKFEPVSMCKRLKKKKKQIQLKNNRGLITLHKKNEGGKMRVTSKKSMYNNHIRERRQFWTEYRKNLVCTDQWKSYVHMFTLGRAQDIDFNDVCDSTDPNLSSPNASQDLTLLEGGLDFAIVFSEIRRFKQKHQLLFPDKLSVRDQVMATRLVKCMSSFKGSQPNLPTSLNNSINYNYNNNSERIEVEGTIRDVLNVVVSTVCTTRNECITQNSDLASVEILHEKNENDIVNINNPEVDIADIDNMNVPDLIKCSNVISNLNETLTSKVDMQKDDLEVNVLENSNISDIKNSNDNNDDNLSENIKNNEDKKLNEPFIENCKTSNIISTECDSQNAIDFMDYYSCIETSMSRSNVKFTSSSNTLLAKNSINKEDVSENVNLAVDHNVIQTNDFHVTKKFAYSIDDHVNSVLSEITNDAEDNGSPSSDDSYNLCIVTNDNDVAVPDNEENEVEINTTKKIGTLPYDTKIIDTNEVTEVAIDLPVENQEDNINIYEGVVNELQQMNSISRTLEDVANNHVVAKIDSTKNFKNIVQHEQDVIGVVSVEKIMICQSNEDKLKTWNVASSSGVLNLDKVNIHDSNLSETVTTDSDEWSSDDSSKPSTISSITHSNLDYMSFSDDSHTFEDLEADPSHKINVNNELYRNIDIVSSEDSNSVCNSLDDDKHTKKKSDVNNQTNDSFIFPLIKTISVISSDDSNSVMNENSLSSLTPSIREHRENDVEKNLVSRELNNINCLERFGQQNLEHIEIDSDQENIDFSLMESETNMAKNATMNSGDFQEIYSDNESPISIQDESDTIINSSCNSPDCDQSIKESHQEMDNVIVVNRIEVSSTIDLTEAPNDTIESKKSSHAMTNVSQKEFIVILDDEDMKSPGVVSPIDPILEYEVHYSTSNDAIIRNISEIDNNQNQNDLEDNSMDNSTNYNTSLLYETITLISSDDSNSASNEILNSSSQSTAKYQENDAENNVESNESKNINSPELSDQHDFDHNSQLALYPNTVSLVNIIEVNQENMQYGLEKSEMNIVQIESNNGSPVNIDTNLDSEIACNSEDDPNMQDQEDVVADNSIEINESKIYTIKILRKSPVVTQEINANSELAMYIEDVLGEISDSGSDSLESTFSHQDVETDINPNQFVPILNNVMNSTTVVNHPPCFVSNKSNRVTDTNSEEPNFELAKSHTLTDLNSYEQDNYSNPTSAISNSLDSSSDTRSNNGDSDNDNDISESMVEKYDSDWCNRHSNAVLNIIPDRIETSHDSIQYLEDNSITNSSCVNYIKPSKVSRQEDKDDVMVTNTRVHDNLKKNSLPPDAGSQVQIKEHKETDNLNKNIFTIVDHSSNNPNVKKVEELPNTASTSKQQVNNSKNKNLNVKFNGTTHLLAPTTNFYIGDFSDLVNNDDGPSLYADIVATNQPANNSVANSTTVTHNLTVTANSAVAVSSFVTVSPAVTSSQTTIGNEAKVHLGGNNETGLTNNLSEEACSSNTDFGHDIRPVYFHNRPTYPTNIPADLYADASVTFTGLPSTGVDPGFNDNFRFMENDNLESFYVDSISHHRFYNNANTIHSNPYMFRENNSVTVLNNYSKHYDNGQLPDQFDANEWKL